MEKHITTSSIFDDLGFEFAEAENLKMRAALMRAIESELNTRHLSLLESANLLGISQLRMNNLVKGKIHLFTIDKLIMMLAQLGKPVRLIIDGKYAA